MDAVRTRALRALHRRSSRHHWKIPLMLGVWLALAALAWRSASAWPRWPCYVALGYVQMSIVTFMHDCTHGALFRAPWKNRAFGMLAMVPFVVSFVAFRSDHLSHHRHNRSPRDPDAFTMGGRRVRDFVVFYAYVLLGAPLSLVYFGLIHPIQAFGRREWLAHAGELALHAAIYAVALAWAGAAGAAADLLRVWLLPLLFFGYFNSARFLAEHYGTPWDAGQLVGTRTVLSNRVNRFFWNNINYHIGHHAYPGVPWYHLERLHELLLPEIRAAGAIVDRGYAQVFLRALRRGPEVPATADLRRSAA